jgi:predicted nucleotidyltransferase
MAEVMSEKISEYFSDDENVIAVYVFGSHARGRAKASSDVDVAVLLEKNPEFDYRLKVMAELGELLQRPVDVVSLRQCGLVLQRQVLKYGVLVFEGDSRKRKAFEIISRKKYFDFQPYHRHYVAKMKERLLKGAGNG